MRLTDDQRVFLLNEFGICESRFFELAPLKLWMLREDCIEVECDEALVNMDEVTHRGSLAASVVDIVSSILPMEWQCKTPQQVQSECLHEEVESLANLHDQMVVVV